MGKNFTISHFSFFLLPLLIPLSSPAVRSPVSGNILSASLARKLCTVAWENSRYCWFACDVTTAMFVVKNKSISLLSTSQLLFLASHRHCLGIGSQFDNAANLFILLFIMKLYHVHLAPDFLPCLHSMITLSYNIRFLMIDEMSQSKLVNHWKVRNFPSGDNWRQIRIQDTLGGQWWLSIFTGRI